MNKRVLHFLISLALIALLFVFVDFGDAFGILMQTDPYWLALGALLFVPDRAFSTLRWYMLLKHIQPQVRFLELFRVTLVSGFLGFFFPGTMGGELLRIYGVRSSNVPVPAAVASVLMERFFGIFGLLALVFAGPFLLSAPLQMPAMVTTAWVCLAVLIMMVLLIFNPRARALTRRLMPKPLGKYVNPKLDEFYEALDLYRGAQRVLIETFLFALAFQVFRSTHIFILALAIGIGIDWSTFLALEPIVRMATLLPVSFQGAGVREVGFVVTLGAVGVPAERALALSTLFFIFIVLATIPGAFLWRWREKTPDAPATQEISK